MKSRVQNNKDDIMELLIGVKDDYFVSWPPKLKWRATIPFDSLIYANILVLELDIALDIKIRITRKQNYS